MNKHQQKREMSYVKLLEASMTVFSQKGYDNSSISDITKEAGYTKGTFYVHFKSKEEFFLILMNDRLEKFKQQFPIPNTDQKNFEEIIEELLDSILEFTFKDSWVSLYFDFCTHAIRKKEIAEQLNLHLENWNSLLVPIIDIGKAQGVVRSEVDSRSIVAMGIAILDGFNLHNAISPGKLPPSLLKRLLLQLILEA